ncbi:transposase [Ensifer adhaerens]|uniref:transposase n=1 Tax=Ensifer adhaerens TaxID=106592 RepID=UPI001CBCE950|nr:transposase [Ensifer adhaerens]MBZ7924193.1 transposase [Ensifer adhaerens]UAX96550.1 transposase [Ensifer adhaerens]UAY04106.1 transposase [Ensifer adhaerens]UAY12092.1 transposase [Ensifer adhaerens]
MAENNIDEDNVPAAPEVKAGDEKKVKAARQKKPTSSAKANTGHKAPRAARHTEEEKTAKLAKIADLVGDGSLTLKEAATRMGISENTYYLWKKAASVKPPPLQQPAEIQTESSLSELIDLEQENIRLRKKLVGKLRAENAELRKKLGVE